MIEGQRLTITPATPESDREHSPDLAPVVDSSGETHVITWEEFDQMVERTRAEAKRFALCPRCCHRQALDRYGRITVHKREEPAGQFAVCPGTGEMTL